MAGSNDKVNTMANVRTLAAEILNLKERYYVNLDETILSSIHSSQSGNQQDVVRPPIHRKKTKKLKGLSKAIGLDIQGKWGIILVLILAVWIQIFRTYGFKPSKWIRRAKKMQCLEESNILLMEAARPSYNCNICKPLEFVPQVENISREDFIQKYAYSGVPVLVKNAVTNWTALNSFSYEFFQDLYSKFNDSFETEHQFFPYKSKFKSLEKALSMSEKRKKKPWYFGWSNDHEGIGKILREHYERPYFLPNDSESSRVDWIFMGTPKRGAPMHLDNVNRPSWQAQIRGRKTWFLVPSPECSLTCKNLNVTVTPGDIIVVDTNQWYHSTFTHEGDISITIGSEYD